VFEPELFLVGLDSGFETGFDLDISHHQFFLFC